MLPTLQTYEKRYSGKLTGRVLPMSENAVYSVCGAAPRATRHGFAWRERHTAVCFTLFITALVCTNFFKVKNIYCLRALERPFTKY